MNESAQPSGVHSPRDAAPPQSHPLDITALTRSMSRGDETAYRTFYTAYFDRLLRYLLVITHGDEHAAREALQLTLLRVVRHIKPISTEPIFWSWLTLLARSSFKDETRKRRRYLAFLEKFTLHPRLHPSPPDTADEKLSAMLETTLQSLPACDQDLIRQKYLHYHSIRQIADNLQSTEKAIESRLARLRRKLKDAVLSALKNEPSQ